MHCWRQCWTQTNANALRYAPSFASVTAAVTHLQSDENTKKYPYTVEGLAKFLGMVKSGSQTATNSFLDSFGALELIAGGYLSEARIKDLEIRKLGEVVASVKNLLESWFYRRFLRRVQGKRSSQLVWQRSCGECLA